MRSKSSKIETFKVGQRGERHGSMEGAISSNKTLELVIRPQERSRTTSDIRGLTKMPKEYGAEQKFHQANS